MILKLVLSLSLSFHVVDREETLEVVKFTKGRGDRLAEKTIALIAFMHGLMFGGRIPEGNTQGLVKSRPSLNNLVIPLTLL